jgi:hypothetical protein
MSVINDTLRFLVRRRLWPVAILLVAAAAAVPMLLAKDPAPTTAQAPTAAVKADKDAVLAEDPIVTEASDGDRSGRRHVLGSRKDPFKPAVTPTPTPTPETGAPTSTSTTGETGAPTGAGSPATGGETPSTGASPVPDPTTPATPKKKKEYELYELTVRFGASTGSLGRKNVKRLQALPSNGNPVLIYLGVLKDKKTAVFLLDSGVVAQGDGDCHPSRTQCETIQIRQGETEFFDVPGAGDSTQDTGSQYQLDVLKLHKTKTTDAKKAAKARASVSPKGRMILRARVAGDGPLRYRYDKKTGRLEKLSKKAYKAIVSKAAHAARAHF